MNHNSFFILAIILLMFFSCEDKEQINYYRLNGVIQKGPFIQGSEVRLQILNDKLQPTGSNFFTQTNDDFGSFEMNAEIPGGFVDISTAGFYFNEVTGSLSNSFIDLKGLLLINESGGVNINILTTLTYERMKYLIINDALPYEQAKSMAEEEVLNVFGISGIDLSVGFEKMSLVNDDVSSSILLAISSILQYENSEAELSELVTKISSDLSSDGILDNDNYRNKIRQSSIDLNVEEITANLTKRYASLGLEITIPSFERYLDTNGDGILDLNQSSSPWFSIESPNYNLRNDTLLEIIAPSAEYVIYYTRDHRPATTSDKVYTDPLKLEGDHTNHLINAIAKHPDSAASLNVTGYYYTYYREVQPVKYSLLSGIYNTNVYINLYSNTDEDVIYYTLDGSTPTTNSNIYNSRFNLNNDGASLNIRAIAYKSGWLNSEATGSYYKVDYSYTNDSFNDSLNISEFNEAILGTWIGTANTPWTGTYNVEFVFRSNGNYSSKSLTAGQGALYYGTDEDNENKTFEIKNVLSNGTAEGDIDLVWSTWTVNRGVWEDISFSENLNELKFTVFYNRYGPLEYKLARVTE